MLDEIVIKLTTMALESHGKTDQLIAHAQKFNSGEIKDFAQGYRERLEIATEIGKCLGRSETVNEILAFAIEKARQEVIDEPSKESK